MLYICTLIYFFLFRYLSVDQPNLVEPDQLDSECGYQLAGSITNGVQGVAVDGGKLNPQTR